MHYEIDDGSGAIVAMADAVVPAGRAKSSFATQDLTDGFCTFTSDGSPDDIRGYAALMDDSGVRTQQVFAAAPRGPSPTVTADAAGHVHQYPHAECDRHPHRDRHTDGDGDGRAESHRGADRYRHPAVRDPGDADGTADHARRRELRRRLQR
jgi:hypothetical protein